MFTPGGRVVVVGASGSGKTTAARALAHILGVPHIELDALHWGPGWTMPGDEEFRSVVASALAGDRWVADGNYSAVRDLIWQRADTVIWLDYPLPLILLMLLRRSMARAITGEELWNGNRERLRDHLARHGLIAYTMRTHARRRQLYRELLTGDDYPHLAWARFARPRAVRGWLRQIAANRAA